MGEPFYFGDADEIFGIYHPPVHGFGSIAAVICPPLFNDYARSHAALRSVAVSLASAGQHVLRFDYRGTGDSLGDLEDQRLNDWVHDVRTAVDEVREISGARTIRVLTARAGALIAPEALSASQVVDGFVLWDPVWSGATYVEELSAAQRDFVGWEVELEREDRSEALKDFGTYRVSPALVDDLSTLGGFGDSPGGTVRAVLTDGQRSSSVDGVEVSILEVDCSWTSLSEDLINPRPVLDELVTMMTAR